MSGSNSLQDLTDVTVVIPYREDSLDRRRNLSIILDYFHKQFTFKKVFVVEQAIRSTATGIAGQYGFVQYVAWRSDAVFHKSRLLNLGIALAETPYVLVYDADVLFDPAALREAAGLLRANEADFVFPFNHVMLQIRQDAIDGIDLSLEFFASLPVCGLGERPDDPRCEHLYGESGDPCAGGAIMVNRQAMLLHGGYNENIVSYSCEDVELLSRLEILGANWASLEHYCCYHIQHQRGQDSHHNSFHDANLAEWEKVRNMDKADLWRYVFNGFKLIELEPGTNYDVVNDVHGYSLSIREQDGRIDLSTVSLVLYIDRSVSMGFEQICAALRKFHEHFNNYEVLLLEAYNDRFRRIQHTQFVIYQRLGKEQKFAWQDIGVKRSARQFVMCIDLRLADLSVAQELLLTQWKNGAGLAGNPHDGITVFDRSPSRGASAVGNP